MDHGDCLLFDLDWDQNEMRLRERSGELFNALTRAGGDALPAHFTLDAVYDRQTLSLRLHRGGDYACLANVPRNRLHTLLSRLLTPRELEIATLLFEGCTIRCIAGMLYIAEGTVKRIIYNVYQKMGVGSQVELVREIYARLAQFY